MRFLWEGVVILPKNVDLFAAPLKKAIPLLREAFFIELNEQWQSYDGCQIGHLIHPFWKSHRWPSYHLSKFSNVQYHRLALGRGITKVWKSRINAHSDSFCRFCHNCPETLDHLFMTCSKLKNQREELMKSCQKHQLDYTLEEIFTNPKLQIPVERFINTNLISKLDETNQDRSDDSSTWLSVTPAPAFQLLFRTSFVFFCLVSVHGTFLHPFAWAFLNLTCVLRPLALYFPITVTVFFCPLYFLWFSLCDTSFLSQLLVIMFRETPNYESHSDSYHRFYLLVSVLSDTTMRVSPGFDIKLSEWKKKTKKCIFSALFSQKRMSLRYVFSRV